MISRHYAHAAMGQMIESRLLDDIRRGQPRSYIRRAFILMHRIRHLVRLSPCLTSNSALYGLRHASPIKAVRSSFINFSPNYR